MTTTQTLQNMKQIIIVNETLKMPKKRRVAQMSQASIGAYFEAGKDAKKVWLKEGRPKIVLQALDQDDLQDLRSKAERNKLPIYFVEHKTRAANSTGMIACMGIGPVADSQIDALIEVFNYYRWVRESALNARIEEAVQA